jgi:hypothetical protein
VASGRAAGLSHTFTRRDWADEVGFAAAGFSTLGDHDGVSDSGHKRSDLVMEQLSRVILLCAHVGSAADELHGVHRGNDHGSAQNHLDGH